MSIFRIFIIFYLLQSPYFGCAQELDGFEKVQENEIEKPVLEENNERVQGIEVERQRTTNQLFTKRRKFYLKKTIKKNQKIDSEWWGGFFLVLGLLVMLSSFAFFILSAYIAPWFALIGVGTLLVGFFISALYVPIVNEKESWLGPILMTCYALVWGGVSMIIWGVVELIKWLIK